MSLVSDINAALRYILLINAPCSDGGLEAKQVINSRYTAETNHFRSLPGHLDSLMLQLTREAQAQATMEYDMA